MAVCRIIAPLYAGEEKEWLAPAPGDLFLCADGGYDAAVRHGFHPDLVIGDFDSMPEAHVRGCKKVVLPTHKDDTDMVACLQRGREAGYSEFRIAGCLGGRLDHTLANLQCLYDCALRGETAWMADPCNRVTVLRPGTYTLSPLPGRKLSLFAWTERVRGIDLNGTEWELHGAELTNRRPLGCSNEVRTAAPVLSFTEGALVLVWSRDTVQG